MSSYVPFAIVLLNYKISPVFIMFYFSIFYDVFPVHAHRCTAGKLGRRGGGGRGVTNKLSEKFYIMYIFADQDKLHIHRIPPFLWDHIYIGRPTLYSTLYVYSKGLAAILTTISDNDTAIQLDRYDKLFLRWSNEKILLQIILALMQRYNRSKLTDRSPQKIAI